MEDLIKGLRPSELAILVAVGFYLAKESITFITKLFMKKMDKTDENTQAVRELNINIRHLTDRLVIVENTMEKQNEIQSTVIELRKDMGYAFEKIRDLEQRP